VSAEQLDKNRGYHMSSKFIGRHSRKVKWTFAEVEKSFCHEGTEMITMVYTVHSTEMVEVWNKYVKKRMKPECG
jgi:hypothetical protein